MRPCDTFLLTNVLTVMEVRIVGDGGGGGGLRRLKEGDGGVG
jgi:hypothetical protein